MLIHERQFSIHAQINHGKRQWSYTVDKITQTYGSDIAENIYTLRYCSFSDVKICSMAEGNTKGGIIFTNFAITEREDQIGKKMNLKQSQDFRLGMVQQFLI